MVSVQRAPRGAGSRALTNAQGRSAHVLSMKIEGPRPAGASSAPRKTNATGGAGFTLPTEEAQAPAAASGVRAAASLDSIMALQTLGSDPQRRGRQLKRG